jgi:hypothetical protein
LAENYDRILAEYSSLDIEEFGVERFFASFDFTSARQEARKGFTLFRPVALPEDQALEPVPVTP